APPAPTQPPAGTCAGVPAAVNGTVTPTCGPIGTIFDIIIRGFTPNEAVTFAITLPSGQVVQSQQPIQVQHPGVLLDEFDSNLVRDYPGVIGMWQVVYRGVTSGNQATVYFQITP